MDSRVTQLEKENKELKEKVEEIMVQLEENSKYRREYANLEVFDSEVQLRSGLTLKRITNSDTDLPVGRVWNDSGTLKIKQ